MNARLRLFASFRSCPVTAALVAANGVVFGAMLSTGRAQDTDVLIRFGALAKHLVWQGQYWRMFTTLFVHYNWLHFGLNMYALYVLGRLVEPALGSWRFLLLYFASGFGGAIGTMLSSHALSLGASGAIFGVVGGLLAMQYIIVGSLRTLVARTALVPVVFIQLALGAWVRFIDNAAHLGGLAAGCVVGYYFAARRTPFPWHHARSRALLILLAAAAAAGLVKGLRPPKDAWDYYYAMGAAMLQSGKGAREAVNNLQRAAALRPDSLPTWLALADAYLRLRPPDERGALEATRRARALAAGRPDLERKLLEREGRLLMNLYRLDEALALFAKARRRFPNEQAFRTQAAACLLDQGRFEEAIALAKDGLKLFPRDVNCYLVIEQAARALGRAEDARRARAFALAYFEKAYREQPNGFNANNLAWTYAQAGENLDRALKLARQAVKEDPHALYKRDTLAWVYFKRGESDKAIKEFRRILEEERRTRGRPEANYARYHLAVVLAKAGRRAEALRLAREALAIRRVFDERWAAQRLEARLAAGAAGK